eukprot:GHVT01016297.1.p1 GENE.GHVT01016297.1~~GHVT01016297.1.p1  ORF type:complete len:219 (-),score=35.24 GHVT01016297.1:693-1349(-)
MRARSLFLWRVCLALTSRGPIGCLCVCRVFRPSTTWKDVDWQSLPAINDFPVQSGVCEPSEGSQVDVIDGAVTARGYAVSGGGREIVRVEASLDRGKTWIMAKIQRRPKAAEQEPDANQKEGGKADEEDEEDEDEEERVNWATAATKPSWAWVLWEVELPVTSELLEEKEVEVWCRAVDAGYNTQPENAESIWNLRGCLSNAWPRVSFKIRQEKVAEQ